MNEILKQGFFCSYILLLRMFLHNIKKSIYQLSLFLSFFLSSFPLFYFTLLLNPLPSLFYLRYFEPNLSLFLSLQKNSYIYLYNEWHSNAYWLDIVRNRSFDTTL